MNMRLIPHSAWVVIVLTCGYLASCTGSPNNSASTTSDPSSTSEVVSPTPETSPSVVSGEVFYQQLLGQYGEDCTECLQPIKVQLQDSSFSDTGNPPVAQPVNVLIALDSSGSMAERVTGGEKMMVAKAAVTQFVQKLPNTANVGLLVYGHKGSNQKADRAISCAGIDTIYPISPLNQAEFTAAVNSVQPTGYTPIAAALQKSEETIKASTREAAQNVIFVVSDGIETCNGDPVAIARRLHSSPTQVIINVIGFDVNNEAQQQLQAVANAGGGKYFSARSAAELNQIFDRSKTLAELNRYRATNLRNRNHVAAVLTQASNQLNACILQKQNRERANILMVLNRMPLNDPNAQYRGYVQERLSDRHQKITAWREQLSQDIINNRDIKIEQLEQDLQHVTSTVEGDL
ncbi:MAG: VWA domain-containing protein [Oculatellaceae cyanobacterium bins.114]|nr:VWA domain-containing protein [Oculatellaceae cyanobacterium bins.114]